MNNKQNLVPIEEVAALLDVSVKFLKQCILALGVNCSIENDDLLVDMSSLDNFVGINEAAEILSVSPRTIRRYTKIKEGKRLKSYRFKNNLLYQLSDIEKFINKSIFQTET